MVYIPLEKFGFDCKILELIKVFAPTYFIANIVVSELGLSPEFLSYYY